MSAPSKPSTGMPRVYTPIDDPTVEEFRKVDAAVMALVKKLKVEKKEEGSK